MYYAIFWNNLKPEYKEFQTLLRAFRYLQAKNGAPVAILGSNGILYQLENNMSEEDQHDTFETLKSLNLTYHKIGGVLDLEYRSKYPFFE